MDEGHFYSSAERAIIETLSDADAVRRVLEARGWQAVEPDQMPEGMQGRPGVYILFPVASERAKAIRPVPDYWSGVVLVDGRYGDWKRRAYEAVRGIAQAEDLSTYEVCQFLKAGLETLGL